MGIYLLPFVRKWNNQNPSAKTGVEFGNNNQREMMCIQITEETTEHRFHSQDLKREGINCPNRLPRGKKLILCDKKQEKMEERKNSLCRTIKTKKKRILRKCVIHHKTFSLDSSHIQTRARARGEGL